MLHNFNKYILSFVYKKFNCCQGRLYLNKINKYRRIINYKTKE